MGNPRQTKRKKPDASEAGEDQPDSKAVRKSKRVLNDVSNANARKTRSSKAQTRTQADAPPVAPRRSARLCAGSEEEVSDEKAPARKTRQRASSKEPSRRTTASKKPDVKATTNSRSQSKEPAKKTTRGRSRSKEPEKKVARGRSRSRSDVEGPPKQDGSKDTRKKKRSRSEDADEDKPARKASRRGKDGDSGKHRAPNRSVRPRSKESRGEAKPTQLSPVFHQEANHTLILTPFDPSKFTCGLSVYDTPSRDDVLETPEYVSDIFQRLYNAETKSRPTPYMHKQPKINTSMRAILVDWLVEVHMKFRLASETLHLCVNIIDRYCALVTVERTTLQLIGVTSLLIACKYEEIYPPEVRDCVYITDRAYTRQQIIDMEAEILRVLEFKITVSTGHPFLLRFLFIAQATETMNHAAHYYMERVLQEHEFLGYRPSLVAAAAVCLAINHPQMRDEAGCVGDKPGVPETLLSYTGYSRAHILQVAHRIAGRVSEEVTTVSKRQLVAVKRKFDSGHYSYVSEDFHPPCLSDITAN